MTLTAWMSFLFLWIQIMTSEVRLEAANQLIKEISQCGRRFFQFQGNVASLELSELGNVIFVDYFTKERIDITYEGHWEGFTSGWTLRRFICALRDFVINGERLNSEYFSTEKSGWAYGDDILKIKVLSMKLKISE